MVKPEPEFLPERYSPGFAKLFAVYTALLFRRRFQCVWLSTAAPLPKHGSLLLLSNHNSWWDGLIPFLLNERVFRLCGRAMMDVVPFRRYPFFRRLGVFSIDRERPRRALQSLAHAAELLNQSPPGERIAFWLYPEGKLVPGERPIAVERGVVWLIERLDPAQCEIVPAAIHLHTLRSDRPELFVTLGEPFDRTLYAGNEIGSEMARQLEALRHRCREESAAVDARGWPIRGDYRPLLGRPPGV